MVKRAYKVILGPCIYFIIRYMYTIKTPSHHTSTLAIGVTVINDRASHSGLDPESILAKVSMDAGSHPV